MCAIKLSLLLLAASAAIARSEPTNKELDAVLAQYGKHLYIVRSYTAPNAKEHLMAGSVNSTQRIQMPMPSQPQPYPSPTPKK